MSAGTVQVAGDLAFSIGADGGFWAEVPGRPAQSVNLSEVLALSVAHAHAPAGCSAGDMVKQLGTLGDGPGEEAVATLVKKGLLRPPGIAVAGGPLFVLQAGELEGLLLWDLLAGADLATLDANDVVAGAASLFEATLGDAQQLGIGPGWARAAASDLGNDLLLASAKRAGKSRWIQFLSPSVLGTLGRIERLTGAARYVVLVRDAFGFIDGAARALEFADPMVLYRSRLQALIAHQPGDVHEALANHWLEFARNVAALKASAADRVHLLRYEDLVSSARAEAMRGLTRFLGVPDARPVDVQPAVSGAAWPAEAQKRIAALVNEGLALLGYAPR